MMHAYNESYLDLGRKNLAEMFDYACNNLDFGADDFSRMFLCSGIAKEIENGNPRYIAGKSGEELVLDILSRTKDSLPDKEYDPSDSRSRYYWMGSYVGFYQWYANERFERIFNMISAEDILLMYNKYHEMDVTSFSDEMNRIIRLSKYANYLSLQVIRNRRGLSQRELSDLSGVPVRTIQQYEQGQKDIRRAASETTLSLARALGCGVEEILQ